MSSIAHQDGPPAHWLLVPGLAIATIFAVFVGFGFYFHGSPSTASGWWYGWPFFGFGWFLLIPLFFILFFGFRWFFWGVCGRYGYYGETPLEAVKIRYARGEITKEQFDEMTKTLQGKE